MNDLERVVQYAFQASGRKRLLEEDFVRLLAHERHWFPPSRVRSIVQAAKARGLLRAAGANALESAEGVAPVALPVDYRPDGSAVERALQAKAGPAPALPLFHQIVRAIAEATQASDPNVVAAVNQLQSEAGGLVQAEVAALWWARIQDVDVDRFVDPVARLVAGQPAGHK